jgi:hypothetical protein
MVSIEVHAAAAAKIGLLARAWNVTHAVAVDRLIDEFEAGPRVPSPSSPVTHQRVPLHAEYQGVAVRGQYDPLSGSLEITDGPAAGRTFRTPSAAAIAVVSAVNPSVNPNRNGWNFWTITATGERLQRIRPNGR